MYAYCVYPAVSKSPKQLSNCLKIAETSVVPIVFNRVLYCYRFLSSLYMNQVLEKFRVRLFNHLTREIRGMNITCTL